MNGETLKIFIEQHPGVIALMILWILPWKGAALWKAARLNKKWWFLALFLINTFGILEILYIFVFSKRKQGIVGRLLNK